MKIIPKTKRIILFLRGTSVVNLIYLVSIILALKTAKAKPKLLNKSEQCGLFQLIIKNGIVVIIIKQYTKYNNF